MHKMPHNMFEGLNSFQSFLENYINYVFINNWGDI